MKHSKIKKTEFSFYSFIAIGLSSAALNLSAEGFDPVAGTDQPKISGMAFDPGTGFQMDVSAAPGVFEVETSETLEDWTPLGDVMIELGAAEFADPTAAGLDRRFYRVLGEFDTADYHLLDLYLAVESDSEGRLYSGFRAMETARLAYAGEGAAALTIFDEKIADIFIAPATLGAAAYIETGELGAILADRHQDGITAQFPAFEEGNPFDYHESREAWELPMFTLEGDRNTLAGVGASPYQITVGGNVTEGREVSIALMGRKSRDADLAGMEGPWGLVGLYLSADGEWDELFYEVNALVADVNAQTGELEITHERGVKIEQQLSGNEEVTVILGNLDEPASGSVPVAVDSDGSLDLFDGAFRGFVSSSGNFFAVSLVYPDLLDGLERGESIEEQVNEAESEYFIGVRRDTNPQLAGRSYRVLGSGNWVEPGYFEIDTMTRADNTLVFGPDGTTAEETMAIDFFRTTFGGSREQGSQPNDIIDYDVSIDPNGLIRMTGVIGGDDPIPPFPAFGFAQEGGEMLVLARGFDAPELQGGGVHVVIAVETELDPGPVFGPDSGDFSIIEAGTWGVFIDDDLVGDFSVTETDNVELEWNNTTVNTTKIEVFAEGSLVNVEWVARSDDGDVYTLRWEEHDNGAVDTEINNPPALMLPASPTAGQTWTNIVDGSDLRELEVLSVDATSPNGIDGCVAIRETSPGDWSDILWFKDGVIVAMQWEDVAGGDPDEVYYPIGD